MQKANLIIGLFVCCITYVFVEMVWDTIEQQWGMSVIIAFTKSSDTGLCRTYICHLPDAI
jgi:hypothetical protein